MIHAGWLLPAMVVPFCLGLVTATALNTPVQIAADSPPVRVAISDSPNTFHPAVANKAEVIKIVRPATTSH